MPRKRAPMTQDEAFAFLREEVGPEGVVTSFARLGEWLRRPKTTVAGWVKQWSEKGLVTVRKLDGNKGTEIRFTERSAGHPSDHQTEHSSERPADRVFDRSTERQSAHLKVYDRPDGKASESRPAGWTAGVRRIRDFMSQNKGLTVRPGKPFKVTTANITGPLGATPEQVREYASEAFGWRDFNVSETTSPEVAETGRSEWQAEAWFTDDAPAD